MKYPPAHERLLIGAVCFSVLIDDKYEKKLTVWASASFALLMVVVGLPLWWETTKVYRVPLPNTHIHRLSSQALLFPIDIHWVFLESNQPAESALVSACHEKLVQRKLHPLLVLSVNCEFSLASSAVKKLYSASSLVENLEELILQEAQSNASRNNQLEIYVLPSMTSLLPADKFLYLGKSRMMFLKLEPSISESVSKVVSAIWDVYSGLDQLRSMLQSMHRFRKPSESGSDVKHSMTRFRPVHNVDLYILHPEPENCRATLDIGSLRRLYLQPFFDKFAGASLIRLKSQNLYYVDIATEPRQSADSAYHFIQADSLPHLINPLEEHMMTQVSSDEPVANCLVYVTPPRLHPQYIVDTPQQKPVLHNSFIVPDWGSFMVYNSVEKCNGSVELTGRVLATALITQLRALMGIDIGELPSWLQKAPEALADWEVDRLERLALADYFLTSTSTLKSLSGLLDGITNIVINDGVGEEIQLAVSGLQASLDKLKSRDVGGALNDARAAFVQAEKAFFDPSLLALLYFPEDQKYAIYVPLFLPVGVPVLLSLTAIWRYFKGTTDKEKTA